MDHTVSTTTGKTLPDRSGGGRHARTHAGRDAVLCVSLRVTSLIPMMNIQRYFTFIVAFPEGPTHLTSWTFNFVSTLSLFLHRTMTADV